MVKNFNMLVDLINLSQTTVDGDDNYQVVKAINLDRLTWTVDRLRNNIVLIACSYDEDNPEFRNITDEIPNVDYVGSLDDDIE
jgi:hypothetical protein